jgi:hypothetical protein
MLAPVYVGEIENQLTNVTQLKDHKVSAISRFLTEIFFWIWISPNTVEKERVTTKVKKYIYKFMLFDKFCSQEIGKLIKGFKKIK